MAKTHEIELKDGPITGKVTLKVLPYVERTASAVKMKQLALKKDDDMVLVRFQLKLVEEQWGSCDLWINGEKCESLEELGYYKQGVELIKRLANELVGGIDLGNSPSSSNGSAPTSSEDDDSSNPTTSTPPASTEEEQTPET